MKGNHKTCGGKYWKENGRGLFQRSNPPVIGRDWEVTQKFRHGWRFPGQVSNQISFAYSSFISSCLPTQQTSHLSSSTVTEQIMEPRQLMQLR